MTCSQIGKELGRTKNSVIGKIDRLGVTRPSRLKNKGGAWNKGEPIPPYQKIFGRTDMFLDNPVFLLKSGECKYPLGSLTEKASKFCCAPVKNETSPYCNEHHSLCYVGKPEKITNYRDNYSVPLRKSAQDKISMNIDKDGWWS